MDKITDNIDRLYQDSRDSRTARTTENDGHHSPLGFNGKFKPVRCVLLIIGGMRCLTLRHHDDRSG
jgi:hypothetical protein